MTGFVSAGSECVGWGMLLSVAMGATHGQLSFQVANVQAHQEEQPAQGGKLTLEFFEPK